MQGALLIALLHAATLASSLYENQVQTHGCNTESHYTFDWEQVYQLDRQLPQGCECGKTTSSDSECELFDCKCGCDLTAGACDHNCCCDPDCSAAEVERFEDSDLGCALHEEEPAFQQCYDAETVNERYAMEYTGSTKQALDELLCVASDNAEVKGMYLSDPGSYEADATVFDDPVGQKDFAYKDVIPGATNQRGVETAYYRGDAMRAALEGGARAAFGGFLPVPTAGLDGQCLETNYGHFLEPVRENGCIRAVDDLSESCEALFDPQRFTELSVCAGFKSSFSSCASEWVPVEVGIITIRDPETLNEHASSAASLQATRYSSAGGVGVCQNAMTDACFYVYHDAAGAISKVIVDFTVVNVTAATQPAATFVRQAYSVEFVSSTAVVADAANNGNAVLRSRSGNPGYITGLPLLNAELITSGSSEAMNARVPGLSVYGGSANPYCDESLPTEVVNFEEDLVTGCVLPLTYRNFTELCLQSGPHTRSLPSSSVRVPKYLVANESFAYLGIFGNADPLDSSQWIQMTFEEVADAPTFDDKERACSSLTTSLHYEVLVAHVGSVGNPQAKVVGARASYGSEEVVFFSETGTQGLQLTTTVSFVTLESSERTPYSPPPPPVLWSVPYDVFYPFDVSAARSSVLFSPAPFLACLMATVAVRWTSALASL